MRPSFTFRWLLVGLFCWLNGAAILRAQSLDATFQATVLKTPLSQSIQSAPGALAVQADGKIIVSGGFDFVNGTSVGKLSRLNADGTTDATFNAGGLGANGFVVALVVQPDGKILVGGGFNSFNGQPRALVVRLNANGSLDPTFTYPTVATDYRQVASLALQADGKVLVGGGQSFGTASPGLLRLNADGSVDNTFNVGLGPNGFVRMVLVQADGKIVAGGSFTQYDGQPAGGLVRLNANGSADASFSIGTGIANTGTIYSLAQQADGNLLVGGNFTQFNGQPASRLIRLLPSGAPDPAFAPGSGASAGGGTVYSILLQPGGNIVIGGTFTQYNNVVRGRIARLTAAGSVDASYAAGAGASNGTAGIVYALGLTPGGQVLAVGGFLQYDAVAVGGVVRLTATGGLDGAFVPQAEARGTVNQVVPLASGQLLVVGNFTQFNGVLVPGLPGAVRRLNANGTLDASFVSQAPATGTVQAVQSNGSFYVASGNTLTRVLASGAIDNGFTAQTFGLPGGTVNNFVTVQGATGLVNGQLLVFGRFGSYGSLTGLNGLVRVNSDGSPDNTFVPGGLSTGERIVQVLVQPTGKVLVVTQNLVTAATTVLRLTASGTLDNTFSVGTAAGSGANYSVLMQPDGRLLVGGGFTSFNGQATPYGLTRLTVDGAADPTFSGLNSGYNVRAVQPDGKILATGGGSGAANVLVRLNADGSPDAGFSPVAIPLSIFTGDDILGGVVLQPIDGKILLYGSFRYITGQVRIGLARLTNIGLATKAATALLPLALYPNPAHAAVTIGLPAAAQPRPAMLLDLNGRLVRRWTVPAQQAETRLSLEAVAAGVYLLQVRGESAVYQQKVVVAP